MRKEVMHLLISRDEEGNLHYEVEEKEEELSVEKLSPDMWNVIVKELIGKLEKERDEGFELFEKIQRILIEDAGTKTILSELVRSITDKTDNEKVAFEQLGQELNEIEEDFTKEENKEGE